MSDDLFGPCANYIVLAELSSQALRHAQERDWEAFALLREREAKIIVQLRSAHWEQPVSGPERARTEALLLQTLMNQHEALALLKSWRDEVAVQLRSIGSSFKLARVYGNQNPPA